MAFSLSAKRPLGLEAEAEHASGIEQAKKRQRSADTLWPSAVTRQQDCSHPEERTVRSDNLESTDRRVGTTRCSKPTQSG